MASHRTTHQKPGCSSDTSAATSPAAGSPCSQPQHGWPAPTGDSPCTSALYLADTATTLIRRALRGESLFDAHREHAYQRLAVACGGHTPAVAFYAVLQALICLCTYFYRSGLRLQRLAVTTDCCSAPLQLPATEGAASDPRSRALPLRRHNSHCSEAWISLMRCRLESFRMCHIGSASRWPWPDGGTMTERKDRTDTGESTRDHR